MLHELKKLFYPHKCIVCGELFAKEIDDYLCPKCHLGILKENRCPRCSGPYSIDGTKCAYCKGISASIIHIMALFPYKAQYKKAVLRWKYKGIRKYGKGFGQLLYDEIESIKDLKVQGIVPVPISRKRYRERGFNQARDLAKELGERLEVPLCDILIRHKHTKPQSACSKEERRKNIRGTIKVRKLPDDIIDKKEKIDIAIIDDIYTTGSTVEECIRALYECKELSINHIHVIVVCIGV